LTGRVAVNRLWQWHMGKGLVATPSDFGLMGEEPTHPELLDWLARRFVDQGWNIKHFERMLITSAAYRRTSRNNTESLATDPENETLWRYPRRRLDGEQIRDALLAVSGRLDRRMGGHGVFPPLPDPLSKDTSLAPIWPETADKSQHVRRTLYLFVRRNLRYPLLETFDRPDTNASCPKREETLIAPQALALLNGKESNTAAGVLAEQIQAIAGPSPQEQVREIFRRLLSREPDNHELDHCLRLLQEPGASVQELCLGIINVSEFIYID
jgi:hypothetical protein